MIDESRKEKEGMKIENQRIKFKTKYHGWLGIDYRVFDYVSGKTQTEDSFEIAGNFTDIAKLNK